MMLKWFKDWLFGDTEHKARLEYFNIITDQSVKESNKVAKQLDKIIADDPFDPMGKLVTHMRSMGKVGGPQK